MASEPEQTSNQSEQETATLEQLEFEEEGNEIDIELIETECEVEDYTPLYSNEDPEKFAAYQEYRLLEQNIKHQNKILQNMKDEIKAIECKTCLTKGEYNNLKNIRENWEREMLKLQDLITKAIGLQNKGSKRHYREFSFTTTFDEDNLNLYSRTREILSNKAKKTHDKSGKFRASAGESSEMNTSCTNQESHTALIDELQEICKALKEIKSLEHSKQKKSMSSCIPSKKNNSLEKIKRKVSYMQEKLCKINEDINKKDNVNSYNSSDKKSHRTISAPPLDPITLCKKMGNANNFQQLKDGYLYLLSDLNKKDEKLRDLTKRLRNSCSKCMGATGCAIAGGDFGTADESELHLLRNRINEMKDEQVEFKCLMKEQSCQLEEYRNKYLAAQQKVEEQCVLLEKLNMNNKCIEKQINEEVKEIRAKFQERLADLLQFPKLLENEQIKLSRTCKEKEDLENKLVLVCKELKNLKSKQQNYKVEDYKPQLDKCKQELCQVKTNMEETQQQRDMFCAKLRSTLDDFNTLRSESAKIIARAKERAEFTKQQQQDHIDRLEKQLAQCRATACLSVNDREVVIKEMQGQLNTLSYSFDAAQKQIKTLRNHIAFISNENSFSQNYCDK